MGLEEILGLPMWTPLVEAVGQISDDAVICRGGSSLLYRLAADTYLAITPSKLRGHGLVDTREGPFVAGVLWAPSEGAARRARFLEIEADEGIAASPVPAWCLPEGVAPRYGDILKALGPGAMESGSYRVASDGKFVCRKISTRSHICYFRGRKSDPAEPPFVVVRHLLEKAL